MDLLILSAPFSHHSSAAATTWPLKLHHLLLSACTVPKPATEPYPSDAPSLPTTTKLSAIPSPESLLLHLTASSPQTPATAMRGADSDAMGLLLKERIVFLGSSIDDFVADSIISQLLLLDAQDSTKDIRLFINSSGGSLREASGLCGKVMNKSSICLYRLFTGSKFEKGCFSIRNSSCDQK